MNTSNFENSTAPIPPSSPVLSTHYESQPIKPVAKVQNFVNDRFVTCVTFFRTIYGLLNIIIIVALVCVLISAGLADTDKARITDNLGGASSAKVSAYHTRNAIIAFAVIVLVLVLVDTLVYITGVIKRLPRQFELIFMIIMFVMAAVLLILGCCSSAWAKKANDTKIGDNSSNWQAIASAVASAIFLFIAMIALIANFSLRIFRPIKRD